MNKSSLAVGLTAVVLLLGFPFLFNIMKNAVCAYLRVYKPVDDARVLIVEGWLFPRYFPDVKNEFQRGGYDYILISGEFRTGKSVKSDCERLRWALADLGVDSARIKAVEIRVKKLHNTLAMALAAKQWLNENDPAAKRVNICTWRSHGRKTLVSYRRALGKTYRVGILSLPRNARPVRDWWKKCEGFRWLVWRLGGALYAAVWPLSRVSFERR